MAKEVLECKDARVLGLCQQLFSAQWSQVASAVREMSTAAVWEWYLRLESGILNCLLFFSVVSRKILLIQKIKFIAFWPHIVNWLNCVSILMKINTSIIDGVSRWVTHIAKNSIYSPHQCNPCGIKASFKKVNSSYIRKDMTRLYVVFHQILRHVFFFYFG